MILDIIWTLIAWSLILPVAFCLGFLFRRLIPTDDSILQGVICYALGFACLSYGVVLLSYLHLLNPISIWTVLIALLIASYRWVPEWLKWLKAVFLELVIGTTLEFKVLAGIFWISFIALLVGTLTPEIGGDALCYHLNLPKEFLRAGSLNPIRFDDNSLYPLFMNNLYLIGLATGGVFTAKLFHLFTGFLLFLATFRLIQNETQNKSLGYFISLVILLTPAIYNMLSTTYVDVAVAFYSFIALIMLVFAFDQKQSGPFLVSGLLIGFAVAIKYLSLYSAIALFSLWIFEIIKGKNISTYSRGLIIWGLGIFLACGYWLIRNWVVTGNPFYPFWASLFGLPAQRAAADYYAMGMGKNLMAFVSVFWNMVYAPSQFGAFATRISVFNFLFLPFVLIAPLFVKRSRPYFIFSFVFFVVWFELAQADRWILPLLAPMGVCAAFGIQWFYSFASNQMKSLIKWGAGSLAILCLSIYMLSGAYHYRYADLLFLGRWSKEEYLTKMERTIPIANWINQNLPTESKILIEAEPQKYYINRPVISDKNLAWHTGYSKKGYNLKELSEFLKSLGITHLLLSNSVTSPSGSENRNPIRELANSEFSTQLYEIQSENIRDARHFYQIYSLK